LPGGCQLRPDSEYQAWRDDQESQSEASTVPAYVTMRQAQLALLAAGYLDAIDAMIATQDRATQIVWNTSGTVERSHPLVASIGSELGLSDSQIDALFVQAKSL